MAVILSAGVYAANIANAIKDKAAEYGWEISLFETVGVPASEWGPTLAKIRQDPPAVICITHFLPADLAQFMPCSSRRTRRNSLIYMQYGPSIPAFRDIAKEAANGIIYATVVGALQDEIGQAFEKRYKEKFGANAGHNSGAQSYDGAMVWATAAALAGGSGEPGNADQNRKVADRMRNMIWRGVTGTTRFMPDEQSAYTYPTQTNDSSLGMPHQFLQIQDYTKGPGLIAPAPYGTAKFMLAAVDQGPSAAGPGYDRAIQSPAESPVADSAIRSRSKVATATPARSSALLLGMRRTSREAVRRAGRPSTTSVASTSPKARCSASAGRTAPARRRCSRSSPASTAGLGEASSSAATDITAPPARAHLPCRHRPHFPAQRRLRHACRSRDNVLARRLFRPRRNRPSPCRLCASASAMAEQDTDEALALRRLADRATDAISRHSARCRCSTASC